MKAESHGKQLVPSERGQGIAVDFLCAALIFLLVLNATVNLINSSNRSLADKTLLNELNAKTEQTLDLLVRTSGIPNNWEENGIDEAQVLGLAQRDRVLDSQKVSRMAEWAATYRSQDYNKSKALLLTGYDYYFGIKRGDGTVLQETGQPVTEVQEESLAVTAKRIVNFNGEEAIALFTVYYPRP